MAKQLTAQEFVAAVTASEGGGVCPVCGSHSVSWGEIRVEGTSTYQEGSCDCGARFYTVSRLVGYGLYAEDGPEVRTIDEGPSQVPPTQADRPPFRIDYELFDRQVTALYRTIETLRPGDRSRKLLEGLAELVTQIDEQRPFPPGKE